MPLGVERSCIGRRPCVGRPGTVVHQRVQARNNDVAHKPLTIPEACKASTRPTGPTRQPKTPAAVRPATDVSPIAFDTGQVCACEVVCYTTQMATGFGRTDVGEPILPGPAARSLRLYRQLRPELEPRQTLCVDEGAGGPAGTRWAGAPGAALAPLVPPPPPGFCSAHTHPCPGLFDSANLRNRFLLMIVQGTPC